MQPELIYIHDPMCSWCWGFRPTFSVLKERLQQQGISIRYVLGGLATDTDQPMPEKLQRQLQQTWRRIQQCIPGTEFNFEFWNKCKPRRSTYPACRAVLAAKSISPYFEDPMIMQIQKAYYLDARNPSDLETLVAVACAVGIEAEQFKTSILSAQTNALFEHDLREARQLNINSYPSLVLHHNNNYWPVAVHYTSATSMLKAINSLLEDDA